MNKNSQSEISERNKTIIQAMRLREEMLLQKKELYKSVPTLNDLCQKYEISQTRLYQIYRKSKSRHSDL